MKAFRTTAVRSLKVLAAVAVLYRPATAVAGNTVLVEAESFRDYGGWVHDQQFMDQMGSPYLLAHGLGVPVKDATTTVAFPAAGTYRVWVRTKDWVARWKAPGTPGKFQLLIDGKPLETVFGTEGTEWHWQPGAQVEIGKEKVTLALKDLAGFEGRCDAILFSDDPDFVPPNKDPAMADFRREVLGLPEGPVNAGEFDLVVVGGGIAGTCAALSAARLDLKVALVQDRPVLGGNNSSEVRVWLGGETNFPPYPRIGDVVRELDQQRRAHYGPANTADLYEDEKKVGLVEAEDNITLFLEHRANAVEMADGRIRAVIAQGTKTGLRRRLVGRWFADCTGDGCLGYLAKADFDITLQGHMGRCNLWNVADTGEPSPFPRCPWALDLSDKPFPGRGDDRRGIMALGGWYWESGFDHDPIKDREAIRDWNFRAMYGAWDALKNVDGAYPNHKLNWAAYIAGPRESRRLLGDVMLTKEAIVEGRRFPDACVPATWSIDLHLPDPRYEKGFEGDAFLSRALYTAYKKPYWVPYRCLYSRNVPNLFMAGRDISVTHEALGAVRVMRTCGMMGEVVGMATSLCRQRDTDPRGVYVDYLEELKALMRKGVGKNPVPSGEAGPPTALGKVGKNLALRAKVTTSGDGDPENHPPSLLNDGHADLSRNELRWLSRAEVPSWVEFRWEKPVTIAAARVISGYHDGGGVIAPIHHFTFERFDGENWQEIPDTRMRNNVRIDWQRRFEPVTADRIRLRVDGTQGDVARIWEIELYAPVDE